MAAAVFAAAAGEENQTLTKRSDTRRAQVKAAWWRLRFFPPNSFMAKEELEDMRKKLATFMLGGDMSGGQAGTHAALTLSNAITNLSVGCWGQVAVLEPLPTANLAKWRQQILSLIHI